MIWDCFMFRDELDMLECRLKFFDELGTDVRHVLTESDRTHRGAVKELVYAANRQRFLPWADRIIYQCVMFEPDPADPWRNEHIQRDTAMRVLHDRARDDDIVLISDVDEYVPPLWLRAHAALWSSTDVWAFRQRLMMYAVDWEYPQPHVCTVAAKWGHARQSSLSSVRDARLGYPIVDGGFHLTWLGGLEAQARKLDVHCHLEMTPEEEDIISSGRAYILGKHHSGTLDMLPVDVDESWPGYIYRGECPVNWFRPR